MRAFITGITGQDGSYLAEQLLAEGAEVHGVQRRASSFATGRIDHIYKRLCMHYGDVTDGGAMARLLHEVRPDEIYNLAAQSHVAVSFEQPDYTAETVALGTLRLLEAFRAVCPQARFYQASSSEMFGNAPSPQSESTPFFPRSPYACAKVFAHNAAVMYRQAYGLFVASGILFNHESPRRGPTFVTQKIVRAASAIGQGKAFDLPLGNQNAMRDWGYAPEYVEAMRLILRHSRPDDFVIATGEAHSVRAFADAVFALHGLDAGQYIRADPRYVRPLDVRHLCGEARKAAEVLGWRPRTTFAELVRIMVDGDPQYDASHDPT